MCMCVEMLNNYAHICEVHNRESDWEDDELITGCDILYSELP